MKFVFLCSLSFVITVTSADVIQNDQQDVSPRILNWNNNPAPKQGEVTLPDLVNYQYNEAYKNLPQNVQQEYSPRSLDGEQTQTGYFPAYPRIYSKGSSYATDAQFGAFSQDPRSIGVSPGSDLGKLRSTVKETAQMATPMVYTLGNSATTQSKPMAKRIDNMEIPVISNIVKSVNSLKRPMVQTVTDATISTTKVGHQTGGYFFLDLFILPLVNALKQISPTLGHIVEVVYTKFKSFFIFVRNAFKPARMEEFTRRNLVTDLIPGFKPIVMLKYTINLILQMIPGFLTSIPKVTQEIEALEWATLPIFIFETAARVLAFFLRNFIPFAPKVVEFLLTIGGMIKYPLVFALRWLWLHIQPYVTNFFTKVALGVAKQFAPMLAKHFLQ